MSGKGDRDRTADVEAYIKRQVEKEAFVDPRFATRIFMTM